MTLTKSDKSIIRVLRRGLQMDPFTIAMHAGLPTNPKYVLGELWGALVGLKDAGLVHYHFGTGTWSADSTAYDVPGCCSLEVPND